MFTTGCASIVPPTGGPRDSLPPTLLKATPAGNTTSFAGKTIVLNFDEYVQVENVFENVLINPPQERFPDIEGRLHNVTIKIKDTLAPNTTYTINFGNSIKDVNENNPLKDFKYVFSTGTYIDSLEFGGVVTSAETGKVDSTLIVILHKNLSDSTVAKEKPRFIARLNGKGEFRFTNLPGGTFNVFALQDQGFKKYIDSTALFAFLDSPVVINSGTNPVQLFAFAAAKEEKRPSGSGTTSNKPKEEKRLTYTTSAETDQSLLAPLTIVFNKPLKSFDSSKIVFTDTLYKPVGGYRLQLDTSGKVLSLIYPWKDHAFFALTLQKGFATDTANTSVAKADTILFKTKKESEYGTLKLKFVNLDLAKHPVLQWIQNEQIVRSIPLTTNTFTDKMFEPGQYKMRILLDANQNGKWDTGNYWQKRQPEKVIDIDRDFNIRANWDNELEVNL